MEFYCEVSVAYSTGGWKEMPHRYWSGKGAAYSRSPMKAWREAVRKADAACGEGAAWICVHYSVKLYKRGKLIKVYGEEI